MLEVHLQTLPPVQLVTYLPRCLHLYTAIINTQKNTKYPLEHIAPFVALVASSSFTRLMQELHFAEWEFSIYFVGYCNEADIPSDAKERTRWCFQQVRVAGHVLINGVSLRQGGTWRTLESMIFPRGCNVLHVSRI